MHLFARTAAALTAAKRRQGFAAGQELDQETRWNRVTDARRLRQRRLLGRP